MSRCLRGTLRFFVPRLCANHLPFLLPLCPLTNLISAHSLSPTPRNKLNKTRMTAALEESRATCKRLSSELKNASSSSGSSSSVTGVVKKLENRISVLNDVVLKYKDLLREENFKSKDLKSQLGRERRLSKFYMKKHSNLRSDYLNVMESVKNLSKLSMSSGEDIEYEEDYMSEGAYDHQPPAASPYEQTMKDGSKRKRIANKIKRIVTFWKKGDTTTT